MRTIRGPIFTLRPYGPHIQETLDRRNHFLPSKPEFQIPISCITILRVGDVRDPKIVLEPQPLMTKDNIEIVPDGVLWACPTVAEEGVDHIFYNLDNWQRAIILHTMISLHHEVEEMSLDESLIARRKITRYLQGKLNAFAIEEARPQAAQ